MITACLDGDEHAWTVLVERYARLVYSVTLRYGLDQADADDVVQTVFVTLSQRLGAIHDDARLPSWLITTTHRACWRLGRCRFHATLLDDLVADRDRPPADEAGRWERQHLVQVALGRLGGRDEQLLRALFAASGGESYNAVAHRLDMPVGSIGPTRARAFRRLERILRELGFGGPFDSDHVEGVANLTHSALSTVAAYS